MEFPVVFILILFALCQVLVSKACDITHECPNDKDLMWATDGEVCHVFRNRCFLENVNCHHRNNQIHELAQISKEQCQSLCITKCPEDDNPVCGYYSEFKQTFPNQCEMEAHICQTGETLFVYGIGPCD